MAVLCYHWLFRSERVYPDFLAEYTHIRQNDREKHKFNVVGGYTFQRTGILMCWPDAEVNFTQNIPVLNDIILWPTDISQTYNACEDGINSRLMSYFGRINYDFDNPRICSFSIRRDGGSNFAPNNKFAVGPSVSVFSLWRLTQEPFMKKATWLDELKVSQVLVTPATLTWLWIHYTGHQPNLPSTHSVTQQFRRRSRRCGTQPFL